MFKQACILAVIILLTLCVTSCTTTTEESPIKGEVVTINELCKTLDSHIQLYNTYTKNVAEGNKLFNTFLFNQECIVFKSPVLAKKLEKVFSGDVSEDLRVEVWKILLNEDKDENEELTYYYIAEPVVISTGKDLSA
tara:strand:+ start:1540 stop:1950 length:411 start_codon:yes stop_codon:yes gene_type:complete